VSRMPSSVNHAILVDGIAAAARSTSKSSGVLEQCKKNPNHFEAVHTAYGWGVIPVGLFERERMSDLTKFLRGKEPVPQGDSFQLQLYIDEWLTNNNQLDKLSVVRVVKRSNKLVGVKFRSVCEDRKEPNLLLTMHYYLHINHDKYYDLPKREAKAKVFEEWGNLTMSEKEAVRQELIKLNREGKTFYRNKIVTIEEKEQAKKKAATKKPRKDTKTTDDVE